MLAAHIILTTYGFWLPNDPRGSWSDFVGAWELLKYGKATKVSTRASVAHVRHNQQLRREAKTALKYPPVFLDDHVHLVIAPHERMYEQIVSHLRSRATTQLRAEQVHPFASYERDGRVPSFWGEGLWKVYCFDREHVRNAIAYVKRNPPREGKRAQEWSFVQPFE
jgi:hypothetical protein